MSGKKRRRRQNHEENAPPARPIVAEEAPAVYTGTDQVVDGIAHTLPLLHPLWIHPDVQTVLRPEEPLYRRLGLVMQQLGARGRTSTVKTCQGDNRGWYRTPLGGSGGSQYYLWWTTAGSRQGKAMGLPQGGIAIRAARHHDNHHPLEPVEQTHYRPVPHASAIDLSIAGDPWTDAQKQFRNAEEPVRVLEGHPGSGKTTALWHSVDARCDDHVLYITWSRALAEDAMNHFSSFTADEVKVSCIDYASLLSLLTGETAERLPLRESYAALSRLVQTIEGSRNNAWLNEPYALHAELRGILLGGATQLDDPSTTIQDGCLRLTDEGYRKHRRRIRGIEERNILGLLEAARRLPAGTLKEVFPELALTRLALEHLRDEPSSPPARLADVDRIVVDEVQDLTLTETSVITTLCKRITEASGRQPKLLMAGDEGQTVRPSSFSWRRTRELLHATVGRPRTYVLDGQVRCPKRISKAAEITNLYYHELEKGTRPGGQHHMGPPPLGGGRLLQVSTSGDERIELLRKLTENDRICVISATGKIPEWVPADLEQQVLTPAEAKGLEYQTVCLINLFAGCCTAATAAKLGSRDPTLSQELRRNAIDQVRVAMTRSTDTLVVLEEKDQYQVPVLSMLASQCAAPDLIADLTDDTPGLERALALAEECRHLRDENPSRALLRGRQALELLLTEKSGENGEETDNALKVEIADAVLGTVATHMLRGHRSEEEKKFAMGTGITAIEVRHGVTKRKDVPAEVEVQTAIEQELLLAICDWREGHVAGAIAIADRFMLLQERKDRYSGWADAALRGARMELANDIEQATEGPSGWKCLRPNVLAWLNALEIEDWVAKASTITDRAFYHLIAEGAARDQGDDRAKMLNRAEAILATLDDDPGKTALIEELEGRPNEALRQYTRAGAAAEAKRVIAENGLWEEAGQLDGDERADSEWLLQLEKVVDAMPEGLPGRLSEGDRQRLGKRAGTGVERLLRTQRSHGQAGRRPR